MPTRTPKLRVSISFDRNDKTFIERLAAQKGESASSIVREAVRRYRATAEYLDKHMGKGGNG